MTNGHTVYAIWTHTSRERAKLLDRKISCISLYKCTYKLEVRISTENQTTSVASCRMVKTLTFLLKNFKSNNFFSDGQIV